MHNCFTGNNKKGEPSDVPEGSPFLYFAQKRVS